MEHPRGLPHRTVTIRLQGKAPGKPFGAFCVNGLSLSLESEARLSARWQGNIWVRFCGSSSRRELHRSHTPQATPGYMLSVRRYCWTILCCRTRRRTLCRSQQRRSGGRRRDRGPRQRVHGPAGALSSSLGVPTPGVQLRRGHDQLDRRSCTDPNGEFPPRINGELGASQSAVPGRAHGHASPAPIEEHVALTNI